MDTHGLNRRRTGTSVASMQRGAAWEAGGTGGRRRNRNNKTQTHIKLSEHHFFSLFYISRLVVFP